MKCSIILFLTLVLLSTETRSQEVSSDPFSIQQFPFEGYQVRIVPVQNAGYGYSIFFMGRMVVQQVNNPFNRSPLGIRSKEDAVKVAKWQAQQLHHYKGTRVLKNLHLPADLVSQLHLSRN